MKKTLQIVGIIILGGVIVSTAGSIGGNIGNLLTIVGFVGVVFGIIQVVRSKKVV